VLKNVHKGLCARNVHRDCAQEMCIGIVRKDVVICAQECGDMCEGIVRKDGVICAQGRGDMCARMW
jgi:phosphopantothenate synthetase